MVDSCIIILLVASPLEIFNLGFESKNSKKIKKSKNSKDQNLIKKSLGSNLVLKLPTYFFKILNSLAKFQTHIVWLMKLLIDA